MSGCHVIDERSRYAGTFNTPQTLSLTLILAAYIDVEGKVNTIIQVGGLHTLVRPDPDQDDKRAWFRKVSGHNGIRRSNGL